MVPALQGAIPAGRRYGWALLRDRRAAHDLLRALDWIGPVEPGRDLRAWLFAIMRTLNVNH